MTMQTMGKILPGSKMVRIFMFLLILAVAVGLFFYHKELTLLWKLVKDRKTPPVYVIATFIILPVFGFPILPLLVLMGVRFGAIIGLTLVFAVIRFHLAVSFWLTNYAFSKPIEKIIKNRSLEIPSIPDAHRLKYSMLFMMVPGLSYSLKNYILPLSGLPIVPSVSEIFNLSRSFKLKAWLFSPK